MLFAGEASIVRYMKSSDVVTAHNVAGRCLQPYVVSLYGEVGKLCLRFIFNWLRRLGLHPAGEAPERSPLYYI